MDADYSFNRPADTSQPEMTAINHTQPTHKMPAGGSFNLKDKVAQLVGRVRDSLDEFFKRSTASATVAQIVPAGELRESALDFTATIYTVPPKPEALLATLQTWKDAAAEIGNNDSCVIIDALDSSANQDQHEYYTSEKISRSGIFKFVAVLGGTPQEVQAIAYIRETSDDTEVIRLATAPWNIRSNDAQAYANAHNKEPVKGAGTACLAASLRAGGPSKTRSLTLSAIDSAVTFYKRTGFVQLERKDFKPTDDEYMVYHKNLMRLNSNLTDKLFKQMVKELPLTTVQ